jgi:hypothetical protein
MKKLRTIERFINSPEEIVFGVNLGEYEGNSTITEVYIKSESIENNEMFFKIKGSIEREGLVFIFKTLSDILKNEI